MILTFNFGASYALPPLTWQDALSEAHLKNPAIARALQNKKAAEDSYKRSYSAVLPQLSASASAGDYYSSPNPQSQNYSLGLSGKLSLYSGSNNTSRIKKAKAQLSVVTYQATRAISDEIYNLHTAFINVLGAQEQFTLATEIVGIRTQNADLIRLQYEAGREDKGSYLRTQADVYQSEFEKAQSFRNLRTAQSALARAIGRDEFEVFSVTAPFSAPVYGSAPVIKDLALATPEYLIAKYQLESSRHDLVSAKSGLYPSIDLNGSAGKSGSSLPLNNDSWSASLNLSYPFYPGGRNIYDIRIAQKNIEIFSQAFREAGLSARLSVERTWNNFVDAVENAGVREKYLAASTEQSVIITTKYLNGLESYQNWYTIQNDYVNSRKALLNAYINAQSAEALWYKVIGEIK